MPKVQFGTATFPAKQIGLTKRTTSERRIPWSVMISDLSGGMGIQFGFSAEALRFYAKSDGPWAQRPGALTLPPIINTTSSLITADFSGYNALNKRPVECETTLGSGELRLYVGLGPYLIGPTSDASAVPIVYHTFTNNITASPAEVYANSTRYLAIATDGTTDDVKVTPDPTTGTDGTIDSLSTYLALASGDRIDVIKYFPQWGKTLLIGKIGSDQGAFFLDKADALNTTPEIAVSADTASVANPSNTTITQTRHATLFAEDSTGATLSSSLRVWNNKTNAGASDNAYAASNEGNNTGSTSALVATGLNHRIPSSAVITARVGSVEIKETDANANAFIDGDNGSGFWQYYAGARIGTVQTDATELATTDTVIDFDGNDLYTYLPLVTPAIANSNTFGYGVQIDITAAQSSNVDIDDITSAITYSPPGTQQHFNLGVEYIGDDPFRDGSFYILEPQIDDGTGRLSPRQLKRVTVTYTTDGDRLLLTVDPMPQPFTYAQKPCLTPPYIYIAASNSSGLPRQLVRFNLFENTFTTVADVRGDFGMEAIELSGEQGLPEAWYIGDLWSAGDSVGVTLVNDAGTLIQDHIFDHKTGAFHAFSPRQTVNTPLLTPKGQTIVGSELGRRFWFVPNSTTDLTVYRQYTPDDVHQDPFAILASYDKQDGPLTITSPEYIGVFGEPRGSNVLLGCYCWSRDVVSSLVEYTTDGGATYPDLGTFTAFGQKLSVSTPVPFQTFGYRLSNDRSATTTQNANPLPIEWFGVSILKVARRWRVDVVVETDGVNPELMIPGTALYDRLQVLSDAQAVQTLKIANKTGALAVWDAVATEIIPPKSSGASEDRVISMALYFDEVIG